MKKISLIFMAVVIAVLAGCAGDSTTEPGTLADVTSFELGVTSAGRNINLVWSEVTDVDGYKIYFKENGTGDWSEIGTSTTTTYNDIDATSAGSYSVRAYKGDDLSENFATAVSTMPNVVSSSYTIVDNWAPEELPSGFRFGSTSGETGSAASASFAQDIYAYDDEYKGDTNVSLYSGNKGSFSNGIQSYFQVPVGNGYCELNGTGEWFNTSYKLYTTDQIVYIALTDGSNNVNGYAKMRGLNVTGSSTEHGTEVTFSYEIQVAQQGAGLLTVFSTNVN